MKEGRLRWCGHVMRRVMEMGYRKRRKEEGQRRFLDVMKENMEKFGAREKDIENRTLWKNIIRCG